MLNICFMTLSLEILSTCCGAGAMTCLHVLLQLCGLYLLVSAVLQPPRNLKFSSENFQHVLTWDDPNNESDVFYKVEYSINYQPLVPTRDCTNISIPRCDLTKDFTDVLANHGARVQIFTHNDSSNAIFTPSVLNPISDTWLGPPIVDVISDDKGIHVSIRPPVSHLWSEKERHNVTMLSDGVYPMMLYTVQLVSSTQSSIRDIEVDEDVYTELIAEVQGSTNYCVSVNVSTDLNYHIIPSPMKCVVTKAPQVRGGGKFYFIVFIIAVLVLMVGLALFTNVLHPAELACRKHVVTPRVVESFPWLKRFLDDSNESSPLVFIPMEIIRTESKEERSTGQQKDWNDSSYTADNGIPV